MKELEHVRVGRFIQQPKGYRAFIPAALPPNPPLAMDAELLRLLVALAVITFGDLFDDCGSSASGTARCRDSIRLPKLDALTRTSGGSGGG